MFPATFESSGALGDAHGGDGEHRGDGSVLYQPLRARRPLRHLESLPGPCPAEFCSCYILVTCLAIKRDPRLKYP